MIEIAGGILLAVLFIILLPAIITIAGWLLVAALIVGGVIIAWGFLSQLPPMAIFALVVLVGSVYALYESQRDWNERN